MPIIHWKSLRKRVWFFGILDLIHLIIFITAFPIVIYIVLFLQDCIAHDCDFTKFASISDPLVITVFSVSVALSLPLLQYLFKRIKSNIDDYERCADLKKTIVCLKKRL